MTKMRMLNDGSLDNKDLQPFMRSIIYDSANLSDGNIATYRLYNTLARYTAGWNKLAFMYTQQRDLNESDIEFGEGAGVDITEISRGLKFLRDNNYIFMEKGGGFATRYSGSVHLAWNIPGMVTFRLRYRLDPMSYRREYNVVKYDRVIKLYKQLRTVTTGMLVQMGYPVDDNSVIKTRFDAQLLGNASIEELISEDENQKLYEAKQQRRKEKLAEEAYENVVKLRR
jgi:hypothetical protein